MSGVATSSPLVRNAGEEERSMKPEISNNGGHGGVSSSCTPSAGDFLDEADQPTNEERSHFLFNNEEMSSPRENLRNNSEVMNEHANGWRREPLLVKLGVDLLCVILVWLPVLCMFLAVTPYQRGFFCDDETIRHPFKDSTVPNTLLYIIGGGLPPLLMIAVELVRWRYGPKESSHNFCGRQIPSVIWQLYHGIGMFAFGAGCSQLLTDIGKYTIGRLRPHFMSVCQPENLSRAVCEPWVYVTDYVCSGPDAEKIHDARLSFPSGHSSFSFYTMLFLVMYLQERMTWSGSWLLRALIQIFAVSLAWYTALSRVSDYKHHPTDVLAGAILGSIIAIAIVSFTTRLHGYPRGHRRNCAIDRQQENNTRDCGTDTLPLTTVHRTPSPLPAKIEP